jgi:L,D-transpeptidase-like protein
MMKRIGRASAFHIGDWREAIMRRADNSKVEAGRKKNTSFKQTLACAAILLSICGAATADASPKPASTTAGESNPVNEVLISIPDRKLALIEDGQVVRVYSVAVGAPETPSPTGRFKIVSRILKPTYYHKGFVIRPGRANPLGNRWIGLDLKGYGIHGTNEPHSIGHAASHGCIRMGKQDVEDLFRRVRVGDVVTIYSERPAQLAPVFAADPAGDSEPKTVAERKPLAPELRAAIADSF